MVKEEKEVENMMPKEKESRPAEAEPEEKKSTRESPQASSLPPKRFCQCGSNALDLAFVGVKTLSSEILQRTKLRKLRFAGGEFSSAPVNLSSLTELRSLNLHSCKIVSFLEKNAASGVSGLGTLSHLKELSLEDNLLESLPEDLGNLRNLQYLNLRMNRLESLPENLENLHQLREAHLDNNRLSSLPLSLLKSSAETLEILSLNENSISLLPQEGFMANSVLRVLRVCKNQLRALPQSLGLLTKLQDLHLSTNRFVFLTLFLCLSSSLSLFHSLWLMPIVRFDVLSLSLSLGSFRIASLLSHTHRQS